MPEDPPKVSRRIPPPPTRPKPSFRPVAAPSLEDLRRRGDVLVHDASRDYQSSRLYQATANLGVAGSVEEPNAVTTLVYDAMRAVVDVHANAGGLKIEGADKHRTYVEYARSSMGDLISADDLDIYDELRSVRNKVIEYPPVGFSSPRDLDHRRYRDAGDRMLASVARWWKAESAGG